MFVGQQLRLKHWQVRSALHKIKTFAGLQPDDRVKIFKDGVVTVATNGADVEIGCIYDEI